MEVDKSNIIFFYILKICAMSINKLDLLCLGQNYTRKFSNAYL